MNIFRLFLRLGLFALVLLFAGCANKSMVRMQKFAEPMQKGDYASSIASISKNKDLYGSHADFLRKLDLGILHHYAGNLDSSIVWLAAAEQELEDLYARSLTQEATAILTNDNMRDYRSRPYEQMTMHHLQTLNYLAKGDRDGAAVQARRAHLAMDALFQKDKDQFNEDPALRYTTAIAYENAGARDDALIAYLKAIKAYGSNVIPLPSQVGAIAEHRLRNDGRENDLAGLTLNNQKSSVLIPESGESEIIVVGYAGRGPVLDELRFWGTYVRDGLLVFHYKDPATGKEITDAWPAPGLPSSELAKASRGAKSASGTTFSINFALPRAKNIPSQTQSFAVRVGDNQAVRTEEIANTEKLLAQNLDQTHTAMLTRTVIRVVLRTMMAQSAKNNLQTSNPFLNLITSLGFDVLSGQLEDADLRVSIWLPRSLQMIRIPCQAGTHPVVIDVIDTQGRLLESRDMGQVKLKKGEKKFLLIPSLK